MGDGRPRRKRRPCPLSPLALGPSTRVSGPRRSRGHAGRGLEPAPAKAGGEGQQQGKRHPRGASKLARCAASRCPALRASRPLLPLTPTLSPSPSAFVARPSPADGRGRRGEGARADRRSRHPSAVSLVSDPEDPDGLIPRATADSPAQPSPFPIQCIFGVALRRSPERQRRRSCPWVSAARGPVLFGLQSGALMDSVRRGDLRRRRTKSCGKCSSDS